MTKDSSLILLEDEGLIRVLGPDAQKYLQGLITTDIREINELHFQFGGCCNNKGRVVASFELFEYKQSYYLLLPKANVLNAMTHLKKYAMFSKVEIQEVTDQFKVLGLWGECSQLSLKGKWPLESGECVQEEWGLLLRAYGNEVRFKIIAREDQAPAFFSNILMDKRLQCVWKQSDIRSGIPSIYPETMGLFTPQMLNYDVFKAINLTKGCYLGQEIVARTASLGRVKKHLQRFRLKVTQLPEKGAPIHNREGAERGIILDACKVWDEVNLTAVVQDDALKNTFFYQDEPLIFL